MVKWIVGGAVLGAGIFAADFLYGSVVDPNLPADWQFANASDTNRKPFIARYVAVGAGAIAVVAVAAPLLGLGKQNPIKEGAGPKV